MDKLLETIFSQKCLFCKKPGGLFCEYCLASCQPLETYNYGLYIRTINKKLDVFSTYDYDGNVRVCIKESKYGTKQFAALKKLTYKGIACLDKYPSFYKGFVVAPIPLNIRKFRSRGFNQAEIIAKILAGACGLPYDARILQRGKQTEVQYKYGREARFENVRGAFTADSAKTKDKQILLVDDICTTGATFTEAAKTLYEAGAYKVRCYSLSRRI
ncbi:MAG TPA: phosphoribosyltransferase family protein [Patescibacteria group bacterium]|nr:phosphoribosyltransferase family protein [Patescibacteria group bacterium]